MDDDRGAIRIKHGIGFLLVQRDGRVHYLDGKLVVFRHVKVRHVACVMPLGDRQSVLFAVGIEMPAGRGEGRLAFTDGMHMQRMFAGRQALDGHLEQDAAGNGRQIGGADVYRHVMRRIWWAYPLYLFSIAPLSRRAFDWGYRTFAANRYRISGACRFEPIPKADVRAVPDDNMRLPGVNTRSKTVPSAASTSIRGARARVSR